METLNQPWIITVLTIFGAVAGSTGFWAWLTHRADKKDIRKQMLLGLAHDRLVFLSMQYIDKGEVSKEEFENLHKYLYLPYKKLGGNGTVEILVEKVKNLPITSSIYYNKE